jgi:glutaminase
MKTKKGSSALETNSDTMADTSEHDGLGLSFIEQEYRILFDALDRDANGIISLYELVQILNDIGIHNDDPRLVLDTKDINSYTDFAENSKEAEYSTPLTFEQFKAIIQKSQGNLVKDAIQGNLVIPDFKNFRGAIKRIFDKAKANKTGEVATYIPQLGRVNPEYFGVSICTIDGQRFSLGDYAVPFCIQSICKPINYCIALEEHGEEKVHQHIGREPSGIGFNGLVLNSKGLPHNPMINAGAIMACSLVKPKLDMADRFDYVLDTWTNLSGNIRAGFNNAVYLSERQTADRNFALGYFMRENKAFPDKTNLIDTLEFYFQCCSIEVTAEAMAITAATLANAGICPTTGNRVLQPNTVKNCLSLMASCGMYDFSGEFAFTIGLPAKSGVAGGLMVVIPNLMGICIWSPRLDALGNSVRGIEFCKELVSAFNFHNFDSLTGGQSQKQDPRLQRNQSKIDSVISLCWAASEGDLLEVQHLVARGININEADYDGRTAMHLAASEGHNKVIEFLLSKGVLANPTDRWGNTPLNDAYRGNHQSVIRLLESNR